MTTTIEFGRRHYHLQQEMEIWCTEHINYNPPFKNWVASEPKTWDGMGTWCMASQFGTTFFYFKNESDAIAFSLKWL